MFRLHSQQEIDAVVLFRITFCATETLICEELGLVSLIVSLSYASHWISWEMSFIIVYDLHGRDVWLNIRLKNVFSDKRDCQFVGDWWEQ